jgi:predicted DNA-binding protein
MIGRPPIYARSMTRAVLIRLPTAAYQHLAHHAAKAGLTMAAYIRSLLEQHTTWRPDMDVPKLHEKMTRAKKERKIQ